METMIYNITSSQPFLLLFDAFSNFFLDSNSSGEEVCFLLTWVAYVGSIILVLSVAWRLLKFCFRGAL